MTTGTVDVIAPRAVILPKVSGADTAVVSGAKGMIGISGSQLVFCDSSYSWKIIHGH